MGNNFEKINILTFYLQSIYYLYIKLIFYSGNKVLVDSINQ